LNEHPAAPSQLAPALGRNYDHVVARAMAKAPAERYPSARAFLDALVAAASGGGADPDATRLADSDRTVLAAGLPAPGPTPASGPPTGSSPGTGIETLSPWKIEALPELEAILSRQIGPMAKFLLRKASSRADGLDELCELLLPHIPSEHGRTQFGDGVALLKKKLAASGTGYGTPGTGTRSATGAASTPPASTDTANGRAPVRAPEAFDDAFADRAAQRLTVFIGPIARVVARRAARQTKDRAEFLQRLAEHIETPPERARFLAEAGSD
ncbi:MAG: hypothetical protein ABWY27_11975, partial [Telluria sp.]